jgi:rod shape determining protein RodA
MYLGLVIMGWLSVYGASYDFDHPSIFDFDQRAGKQLLWILCGFLLAVSLVMIDSRIYDVFAYLIYVAALLLLIATIFLAPEIKGSRSWLVFGPVSIQSAELAKFATGLALAKYMSSYNYKLQGIRNYALCLQ